MNKSLVLIFIASLLFVPINSSAQGYDIGSRIYVVFAGKKTAAAVYTGRITEIDGNKSRVRFDDCNPQCYKWVPENYMLDSRTRAQEQADETNAERKKEKEMAFYRELARRSLERETKREEYSDADLEMVYFLPHKEIYHEGKIYVDKGNWKEREPELFALLLSSPSIEDKQDSIDNLRDMKPSQIEAVKVLLRKEREGLDSFEQKLAPTSSNRVSKLNSNNSQAIMVVEPSMVRIPGGVFNMGGSRESNESPIHEVNISSFMVSKYETTFIEYDAYLSAIGKFDEKPSDEKWGRMMRPVVNVSRIDAVRYAKWLSAETGKKYRLLTEAEWEYVAKAGKTTEYPWGNLIERGKANCLDCVTEWSGKKTARVGSYQPNDFGVYDMNGNVGEWVYDCYHSSYKGAPTNGSAWVYDCYRYQTETKDMVVVRGGSWSIEMGNSIRATSRWAKYRGVKEGYIGFRLAQDN